MNLTSDPWIPVVGADGEHRLVGLETLFREGERIADLAANPCQRIALMRLLICIAQAALDGPEDEAAWASCRPKLSPAALDYLARWRHRFNLFGEHAFLQVDGLEPNNNALADKLDLMLACGNNPTLFDHGATPGGRMPTDAQLAIGLLVYQMFSPGGLMGTARWNGAETGRTSEHAVCLEGSMLHTLLRGSSLTESVHLNLLDRTLVSTLPNAEWGRPSWELNVCSREALEELALTYLGRLVPVPRAIRCRPDSQMITLASGVCYPKLPEWREPAATVIKIGRDAAERMSYVAVNLAKHPWRELASILALQSADKLGGALPLNHMRRIERRTFDVWTGGMAADKAKLLDMGEWTFSLPVAILDTLALGRYQAGVDASNSGVFTLRMGVKKYAEVMKCEAIWNDEVQRRFWTILNAESAVLAESVVETDDQLSIAWMPLVRSAMQSAYAQTCPHETPRQIQAYAQGLRVLDAWKGGAR